MSLCRVALPAPLSRRKLELFDSSPVALVPLENLARSGNLRSLENCTQLVVALSGGVALCVEHVPRKARE